MVSVKHDFVDKNRKYSVKMFYARLLLANYCNL